MSGVATRVEENRALKLSFEDSAFTVVVGFSIDAVEGGTRVIHFIDINPKSVFGRLLAPMIRKGNAAQVVANLSQFKNLLESSGWPSRFAGLQPLEARRLRCSLSRGSSLPHNGMQRTVLCFAAEPERWANHDDGVEFARWRRVQEERTLGWQHH
jgi:hypothetical protein